MLLDEIKQLKTGTRELRNFGLLVGGVFALLAAWFLWRGKPVHVIFWTVATPLLLLGLIYPRALRLVYLAWMAFAVVLGTVVSTILLTVFFYIVVTPIGLLARVSGKDFLSKKLDGNAATYWIKRDVSSVKTAAHYEQQF